MRRACLVGPPPFLRAGAATAASITRSSDRARLPPSPLRPVTKVSGFVAAALVGIALGIVGCLAVLYVFLVIIEARR